MSGLILGDYTLTGCIGRGGMGEVWAATHALHRVPVAVKLLTLASAREPRFQEAFRNEVRAVAVLDHPAIVEIYDYGTVGEVAARNSDGVLIRDSPYFAMELADGNLRESGAELTWISVRRTLRALLEAFAHAHARGVVHRDLKPDNILFREGRVKLSDFGVARALDPEGEVGEEHDGSGTPPYMAPEQVHGRWRDQGPWTDLYALGCLTWELVAGHTPYGGNTSMSMMLAHITRALPPLRPRIDVPEGLEAWVARLLMKDPRHRYRRAADALYGLMQLGLPASMSPGPGPVLGDSERPDTLIGGTTEHMPTELDPLPGLAEAAYPDETAQLAAVLPHAPPCPETWRHEAIESTDAGPLVAISLFGLRAAPFVAREQERDALWGCLGRVHERAEPEIAVIVGNSGSGKSRLGHWMAERAEEVGAALVLRAAHAPILGAAHGLAGMLRRHLRCVGLERDAVQARVEAHLLAHGESDPNEVLALTELLCPVDPRVSCPTVRFGSRLERFLVVQRVLCRLAIERPVLIWMDDAQWSREAIDFAEHLLEQAPALPVMVLMTVHSEALNEHAGLRTRVADLRSRAVGLDLGPLEQADQVEMLQAMLGLDPELARHIAERADGQPLLAEQLVGAWVRRGALMEGPRGYVLRPEQDAEALPEDLRAVWAERLAGRSSLELEALEVAALLGPQIDFKEWRGACEVLGLPAEVALVEALLDEHLATCEPLGPRAGWSLAYGMLREHLLASAEEAGRSAGQHRACALLLARGVTDELGERRGRHLLAAGEDEAAIDPLLDGVEVALRGGEHETAAELLDLRELAASRAELPRSDPRWGAGWLRHSRLERQLGRLDDAEAWLDRAEAVGQSHGWTGVMARCGIERGVIATDRGRFAEAEQRLLGALEAAGPAQNLVARCRQELGLAWLRMGRHAEAAQALERAAQWFEATDDAGGRARCEHALAHLRKAEGRLGAARLHNREAYALFLLVGARKSMAGCDNQLGELSRLSGDLESAERHYRSALETWTALGDGNAVFARANLALVLLEAGHDQLARPHLEAAAESFERDGRQAMATIAHACLLPCCAADEDWGAFERHLERAELLLGSTALRDADVARMAARAAERAVGHPDLAQRAARLGKTAEPPSPG